MLSRVIKFLLNKPTEIEGPIFIKDFKKENKQITKLEKLLKKCDEHSKKQIEQDLKKLRYGQIGENNVYYELKNTFVPMICLYDLRLQYKGKTAQIDFLAITSKFMYVIECKNLIGDIKISEEGEFIRYIKNSHGKIISKEGMYSPIAQNERHINVIKEILKDELKYKNKLNRIESLVVTANPKTIINKKKAPHFISDRIIRHDQIVEKIQSHDKDRHIDWVFIEKDMREIGRILMKYHREEEIDYYKKYSIKVNYGKKNKKHKVGTKSDEELRDSLKNYRLDTSKKENMKPYMIFNNETMEEIIKSRPKNLHELKNIKGFGQVKCEKYGTDLLDMMA